MTVTTRLLNYDIDGTFYESLYTVDESLPGPRPSVLIFSAVYGRSEHEESVAKRLAELGYAALAVDIYGVGTVTANSAMEDLFGLMMGLVSDRDELFKRGMAALNEMNKQPESDPNKVVAIGYCFGGLSIFDMARRNAPIAGVVGFHPMLIPPTEPMTDPIKPKVLGLIAYEDAFEKPDNQQAFMAELHDRKADWQCLVLGGGALHGFSMQGHDNPEQGVMHDEAAEKRSWNSLVHFLEETIGS